MQRTQITSAGEAMTIVFDFLLFNHHHGGHENGRQQLYPQLNDGRIGCELNFLLALFAGVQHEITFSIFEREAERLVSEVAAIDQFILAQRFRVDDAFIEQEHFALVLSPCVRFEYIELTDLQEFALMLWIDLKRDFRMIVSHQFCFVAMAVFTVHCSLTSLQSAMSFMFIEPFTVSSNRCKRFSAKQQAAICCFTPSSSRRLPSSDINWPSSSLYLGNR